MNREEVRWVPQKPDCDGGLLGFKTVGLNEVKPAVNLLLFGYVSSILILGFEILSRIWVLRFHQTNKKRTRFIS